MTDTKKDNRSTCYMCGAARGVACHPDCEARAVSDGATERAWGNNSRAAWDWRAGFLGEHITEHYIATGQGADIADLVQRTEWSESKVRKVIARCRKVLGRSAPGCMAVPNHTRPGVTYHPDKDRLLGLLRHARAVIVANDIKLNKSLTREVRR